MDGRIFQTINCHRPRSLAAVRMGIDAALVFVERDAEVRVLVYRGIEGFVVFAAFTLPERVVRLHAVRLAADARHACDRQFVVVALAHDVRLLEAVGSGFCGLRDALRCD